jgi:TonB-dependent receptor
MFKRNKLTSAMLTVMAGSAAVTSTGAFAQGEEELYVTGIRASVQRAMDIKRDSSGVVDAISAEDIGKFPDSNLAESLQRITGVSIDRRNGEGFQVTVRGFGPQFNLVTLNGRSMPTSLINVGKTGSGPSATRSFDMSNLASEGVSGVEVYKTGRASISSGGIGATINMKTRKPFDNEGLKFSVGAKALMDTTNRVGRDITPELGGFLSWSNDVFGASVSYSHQERDSANSGVFSNNWAAYSGPWSDASFFEGVPYQAPRDPETGEYSDPDLVDINPEDVRVINAPSAGQQTNMNPGIRYHHGDYERKRDNTQVTVQFRPVENLTFTADYTAAEQELFVNSAELSFWFGGGSFPITDVQFDGRSDVATPTYIYTENPTGVVRDTGITQNQGHIQNNLYSTGINIEWLATESLTFTLDAHQSNSESTPGDGAVGDYFNIGIGAQGYYTQGIDNSGDLPLLVGIFEDDHRDGSGNFGLEENVMDVGDLGSTVRQIWNNRAWGETTQVKLDGSWEFSENGSIDFGVESSEMEATQKSSFSQIVMEGNWGVGTPGDVPPEFMQELDYGELFDGYSTTLDSDAQAFFNASGYNGNNSGAQAEVMTRGWIAEDVDTLGRVLSHNAGLEWAPNPNDGTNRTVTEEITAFYVQGDYRFDFDGVTLDVAAGVRYEETDVESQTQVGAATIQWQGDNDLLVNTGAAFDQPITFGSGSYDHTLPSLDVALTFAEDFKLRASYSTTIARANYNSLIQGVSGIAPPQGGPTILGAQPGNATNGNPNLKPLESDNIDISFEWYFADTSYASVGYFIKDVPNFVGNATAVQPVPVLDPTNGPRAQAALDAINADSTIPLNQQTLFQMIASMSTEGVGCTTVYGDGENAGNSASCGDDFDAYEYEGTAGWEDNIDLFAVDGDPIYNARVNFPVDNQSAQLDGWELAVQHFFGETGFGIQANYTIVNGDIEYDITGAPGETQFALVGLSDSANLVLMYERDALSARLAYNWRDEFLYSTTASANEPGHTEAYAQLDLNVSYNITDNFSVAFEGLNLTEEDSRQFARTERQLIQLDILGARYALSARYNF